MFVSFQHRASPGHLNCNRAVSSAQLGLSMRGSHVSLPMMTGGQLVIGFLYGGQPKSASGDPD